VMKKVNVISCRVLLSIILIGSANHAYAEAMTYEQILQRVVGHYPSLKIASMQVEKASKESVRVNSQFGWQLSGQTGVSHETSIIGTGLDRAMISGDASRKLKSGDIFSFSGALRYDDNETPLTPALPNPSTNLDLELSYRKPLGKGADNIDYQLASTQAEAGTKMAQAKERATYDQIASQVIDLYLLAVTTHKQIDNVKKSISDSRRLYRFVKSRLGLGISESKDELQVTAQLNGLEARLKEMELLWVQQEITLNRLMGLSWDNKLEISLANSGHESGSDFDSVITEAIQHSPDLVVINADLAIAETIIKNKRNNRKDTVDLVGFVGNKLSTGDLDSGSTETLSEPIVGMRIEYKKSLDQSGQDAELSQAFLDRSIALQRREEVKENIHYQAASLLAELNVSKAAHNAAMISLKSEQAKLADAEKRYRKGRIEIDRLIQFESELNQSRLSLALRQVEFERRRYKLALLRGVLWQEMNLPQYDWAESLKISGENQ